MINAHKNNEISLTL